MYWARPQATDNSGDVQVESNFTPGAEFSYEDSPFSVTYQATDGSENVANCTFMVTIEGNLVKTVFY